MQVNSTVTSGITEYIAYSGLILVGATPVLSESKKQAHIFLPEKYSTLSAHKNPTIAYLMPVLVLISI